MLKTPYQHSDLSDRGTDDVKSTVKPILDHFLEDNTPAGQVEAETLQDNSTAGLLAASASPL